MLPPVWRVVQQVVQVQLVLSVFYLAVSLCLLVLVGHGNCLAGDATYGGIILCWVFLGATRSLRCTLLSNKLEIQSWVIYRMEGN